MSEADPKIASPSASGSFDGYTVEARWNYPAPKAFGKQILDREWRKLTFDETTPYGVPNGGPIDGEKNYLLRVYGLFTYSAAQALRWWFIADANASEFGMFCLETRIVMHRVSYSSTAVRGDAIENHPPLKDPQDAAKEAK